MHKYLRAVGFSSVTNRDRMQILIAKTVKSASECSFTTYNEETLLAEYRLEVAPGIGITVCGEMDEEERFLYDYSYPYIKPDKISSKARLTIERHADKVSYAGVCDDNRVGITIIFYLLNRIEHIKKGEPNILNSERNYLSLSGLSIDGIIMMPVDKPSESLKAEKTLKKKRERLVEAARKGDEDAIETLTLDDMDMYSSISRKIKSNDVYTLVDTYFMPYGIECDQYSVMGEIEKVEKVVNSITGEAIYKLSIISNEIPMMVCINKNDLFGEPEVGRRFKGTVWLQGQVNNY